MPVFEYVGLTAAGANTKGTIDAEHARAARQRLRGQGIFPTEIKESRSKEAASRTNRPLLSISVERSVSTRELAVTTRQLATLVHAGLPLVNALQALSEQCDNVTLRRIVVSVREYVEEGSSLAQALSKYPKVFPRLYINMVASGEASGTLDTVLLNVAHYLESQVELQGKVRAALLYPIVMLVFCVLVITTLLMFVVPKIVEIFEKQGIDLPIQTRVVIASSHFLISYWYLLIGIVLGGTALTRWYYRQPQGRAFIDKTLLQLPIFRPIYIKVLTARVSQTLGALLASGVGLLQALEIVKNIVGNVHVVATLESARDGVREGKSLARELSKSGIFPVMLGHMVAVGERSGELESMLTKAGTAYENDVKSTLSSLTSILEPLMIVVVGGIVLLIVLSVLSPMVTLMEQIQG